jgi:selenocysteine lyase/cysteine desulfurase
MVRIYGHGGIVAFNLLDGEGMPIPFADVEARAAADRVALRGGCFCNPGAAESAFGWPDHVAAAYLTTARSDFSIGRFAASLGRQWAVGALRASLGLASNVRDVERTLAVAASFRN